MHDFPPRFLIVETPVDWAASGVDRWSNATEWREARLTYSIAGAVFA